jgi:TonB family protein
MMIVASFAVSTSAALAGEVPPVSPPAAQGSTDVPYPADGKGDAAVVLEIVVEKDGTVSEAKVIEGAEPFAEHARQAVLGWKFAPALRGMEPVAARIRARVEFHQEPTPEQVGPEGPPTAADAGTPHPPLPEQVAPP